jgi:hypothetical protein
MMIRFEDFSFVHQAGFGVALVQCANRWRFFIEIRILDGIVCEDNAIVVVLQADVHQVVFVFLVLFDGVLDNVLLVSQLRSNNFEVERVRWQLDYCLVGRHLVRAYERLVTTALAQFGLFYFSPKFTVCTLVKIGLQTKIFQFDIRF